MEIFAARADPNKIPVVSAVAINPMITELTERDKSSNVTVVMSRKLPRLTAMLFKVRAIIARVCRIRRNPAKALGRK
ncbi:hypothetical protein EBQ10_06905 [Trueperella pyogenes]|uniref:Uncharacterized protein n=1 Tax=Trueperella pyogenes TaxID=1661 RepID=A0A3Q9GG66_9ACTO|nr:hypothetical protein DC090_04300 [Trueperella pyogenes]AWG16436.1 hypothetical protein DDE06_06230 [Trueperella pyogenes]AZR05316.1 hypothetical protein EBQ11_08830 [Trueperella pyogenes]AZR07051.1 hypothetical protein EBQ10_06905 [Trueperella pyogenes]